MGSSNSAASRREDKQNDALFLQIRMRLERSSVAAAPATLLANPFRDTDGTSTATWQVPHDVILLILHAFGTPVPSGSYFHESASSTPENGAGMSRQASHQSLHDIVLEQPEAVYVCTKAGGTRFLRLLVTWLDPGLRSELRRGRELDTVVEQAWCNADLAKNGTLDFADLSAFIEDMYPYLLHAHVRPPASTRAMKESPSRLEAAADFPPGKELLSMLRRKQRVAQARPGRHVHSAHISSLKELLPFPIAVLVASYSRYSEQEEQEVLARLRQNKVQLDPVTPYPSIGNPLFGTMMV